MTETPRHHPLYLAVMALAGTLLAGTLLLFTPATLLASRVFTATFTLFVAATSLRLTMKAKPSRRKLWLAAAASPVLALATVGVFIHTELSFWGDAPASAYCKGVGHGLKACGSGLAALGTTEPRPATRRVEIVMHGWHTGLVLATKDLDPAIWPEGAALKETPWVELGWGDARFFPAEEQTLAMALDAMVTPDPSVLHVAQLRQPPKELWPTKEILRLDLPEAAFQDLVRFVGATFYVKPYGGFRFVFRGDYGDDSRFVAANGLYHFPNTCNVWTAEALKRGGLPISPATAITSRALMAQLRPFTQN